MDKNQQEMAFAILTSMNKNEQNESTIIQSTSEPITVERIKRDLVALGVREGETILVHTKLSSLGWVNGGAVAVIQALQETVTPSGTIIMPTQSGNLSDPAAWGRPPAPESWWETIRESMPGYDLRYTPTRGVGQVPEIFRTFPDVVRSAHPQNSFSAWGLRSEELMEKHELEYSLGENSPLAKLYKIKARVLFIGTSYETHTSFHLAEYRSHCRKEVKVGTSILEGRKNKWIWFKDIELDNDCFEEIGLQFEKSYSVIAGKIGNATAKLFDLAASVDFATKYLSQNE